MKSKEEILKRAIILLAFSDRCALEKKIIDGVRRSLNDEEMEELSIISERRFYVFEWLSADDEWDNVDLSC